MIILFCILLGIVLFMVGTFRCFGAITNYSWHQTAKEVFDQLLSPKAIRGYIDIILGLLLMLGPVSVIMP